MYIPSPSYKKTGINRLLKYKEVFQPADIALRNLTSKHVSSFSHSKQVDDFVNTFCEYQLADNDYMNIHLESDRQKDKINWFGNLPEEKVLKLMTYIIWTDKFVDGYLTSRITDGTLHLLLNRLETLQISVA